MPGGKCPGNSWRPDFLGARVNADFNKFCTEGEHNIFCIHGAADVSECPSYSFCNASGALPRGMNSAYSSIALMPKRAKAAPNVSLAGLSERRARILSQTIATALQTLAVVIEPPDTGDGGRFESPSNTLTCDKASQSFCAAICAITV
jgi:hypothetical protein